MGKRIGVFGGSFNPIHHGHLVLAQDVMEICELDEVRFVPCGIPVHKAEPELAAAVHRVEMVQLSIRSDHRFTVSDYEVSRDTASYTVDTLEAMLVESPGCELTFLLGTDSLPELHNWHRINDLLSLVAVVSVVRPGFEPDRLRSMEFKLEDSLKERLLEGVVTGHMIGISSSDIRRRVADRLGIRYLVPLEVEVYIAEQRLYTHRCD